MRIINNSRRRSKVPRARAACRNDSELGGAVAPRCGSRGASEPDKSVETVSRWPQRENTARSRALLCTAAHWRAGREERLAAPLCRCRSNDRGQDRRALVQRPTGTGRGQSAGRKRTAALGGPSRANDNLDRAAAFTATGGDAASSRESQALQVTPTFETRRMERAAATFVGAPRERSASTTEWGRRPTPSCERPKIRDALPDMRCAAGGKALRSAKRLSALEPVAPRRIVPCGPSRAAFSACGADAGRPPPMPRH